MKSQVSFSGYVSIQETIVTSIHFPYPFLSSGFFFFLSHMKNKNKDPGPVSSFWLNHTEMKTIQAFGQFRISRQPSVPVSGAHPERTKPGAGRALQTPPKEMRESPGGHPAVRRRCEAPQHCGRCCTATRRGQVILKKLQQEAAGRRRKLLAAAASCKKFLQDAAGSCGHTGELMSFLAAANKADNLGGCR